MSKDPWPQLMQLKAVTFQTGVMHQAQIDHLRIWGQVAFQFIPKDGFECHISSADRTVGYVLKGGKLFDKRKGAEFDFKWLVKAIAVLNRSIHQLLGEDWQVTVTHNGKIEYTGPRLKDSSDLVNERREYRSKRAKK